MVAEVPVLLGIEHLEHRARRVAAKVCAHLVDLVDQQHGVHRLRVAKVADDRARHRADVGTAVAADLGLVAHAADRQAGELPAERPRDRLPERGLADAGRSDEAENGPGGLVLQLRDREVLEDALLDLPEVEVVLVEDLLRIGEIEVVDGGLVPRQRGDPVEVGADDAVLGRRGRKPLEPSELAVDGLLDLLGKLHRLEPGAELLDLSGFGIAFAELFLDRLQLLAEEELPLPFLHLLLNLRLDLRAELEDLELAVQDRRDLAQAALDVGELEQALLLLGLEAQC